jgi:ribose transport system substrate-binding protein
MPRLVHFAPSTVAAVVLAAAALTGCGEDSDGTNEKSATAATGAAANVDLDALYSADGYKEPPTESPKPQPGKKIALLSCGQTVAFCKVAIAGAQDAAKAIGWTTTLIDSKGDANIAQTGLKQAIAARVDGIFVEAFDCQYIKSALEQAKAASIPVVAEESRDCNENLKGDAVGGPKLFAARVNYPQGDFVDWLHEYGRMQAEYMMAKTDGDLNVVSFAYSDLAASLMVSEGFKEALKDCPECKNTEVRFTVAEAGSSLQQKAQQALLKNPKANYVRADSDGTVLNGVYSAVEASRRDLPVMASEGSVEVMDLARDGKDIAGIGIPVEWFGYAAIDILNRHFNGDEPAPAEGPGLQVWDREHNLPASGAFKPPIDFRAGFLKAWGVE